eukprot:3409807-Rhodomonas_salina.1
MQHSGATQVSYAPRSLKMLPGLACAHLRVERPGNCRCAAELQEQPGIPSWSRRSVGGPTSPWLAHDSEETLKRDLFRTRPPFPRARPYIHSDHERAQTQRLESCTAERFWQGQAYRPGVRMT